MALIKLTNQQIKNLKSFSFLDARIFAKIAEGIIAHQKHLKNCQKHNSIEETNELLDTINCFKTETMVTPKTYLTIWEGKPNTFITNDEPEEEENL